jgi:hypothetical protein
MGVDNIIGGAGELLLRLFGKYFSCAFCMVLVGLSVYWPSMRSLWMGVLVPTDTFILVIVYEHNGNALLEYKDRNTTQSDKCASTMH